MEQMVLELLPIPATQVSPQKPRSSSPTLGWLTGSVLFMYFLQANIVGGSDAAMLEL